MIKLKLILLSAVLLLSQTSTAAISQKRLADESFQQAISRIQKSVSATKHSLLGIKDSALRKKVPISELKYDDAPELASQEELTQLFQVIRDSRFLHSDNDQQFDRRITWLYPDDGCYARAAMSGIKLEEEKLVRPAKIFAFGHLSVTTPYSEEGSVSWWYHVAPLVRYKGEAYVLDPAINPKAPLTAEEWYKSMSTDSDTEGAVCNTYAYDPLNSCDKADKSNEDGALDDQTVFLDAEWDRVSELGFDPVALLGDLPPWLETVLQ